MDGAELLMQIWALALKTANILISLVASGSLLGFLTDFVALSADGQFAGFLALAYVFLKWIPIIADNIFGATKSTAAAGATVGARMRVFE